MVVNLASTGSNVSLADQRYSRSDNAECSRQARCYVLNGPSNTAPDWLQKRDRAKRRKKENGQGIRLIQVSEQKIKQTLLKRWSQDFEFPEASNKIRTSRDGQYCLVTGTYKPRLKIYDLPELSLKSERVTDAENVDFLVLSDDWTKTLHLQADRSVSVHTASSVFYSTRVPSAGRCLAYNYNTCDALIGAKGNQIFRLNLDQGRFLNPLDLELDVDGAEALDVNPAHGLISVGTQSDSRQGTVEFWDPRSRTRAGVLHLPQDGLLGASSIDVEGAFDSFVSVTSLASRTDGLNLAVGTSSGHTLLYDLRSNSPYTVKDQGYGLPIKKVEWCYSASTLDDASESAGLVASIDSKVMKIWGSQSSKNLISINPPNDINDLHVYPSSGLVFLANEATPVTAYYIPQLGTAPKWCRFLDNMTEELEEDTVETLYDDYKFVDKQELRSLGMDHLIGSDVLKPYMHGYFVDLRLYTKARAIANPFAYAEYRDRLVREKLDKERESRIRQSKNAVVSKADRKLQAAVSDATVNKELAEKVKMRREKEEARRLRKAAYRSGAVGEDDVASQSDSENDAVDTNDAADTVLTDKRFSALFQDPEFQVDQESAEFAMLNPSTAAQRAQKNAKDRQAISASLPGDEDSNASDNDDDADEAASSEDDNLTVPARRSAPSLKQSRTATTSKRTSQSGHGLRPQSRPQLVVEDANGNILSSTSRDTHIQTLGQRAAGEGGNVAKAYAGRTSSNRASGNGEAPRAMSGGGMEFTFNPTTSADDDDKLERQQAKKARADKQAKERLAAGRMGSSLEKGSGTSQNARAQMALSDGDRSGRKTMRRQIRSASRNKTRYL